MPIDRRQPPPTWKGKRTAGGTVVPPSRRIPICPAPHLLTHPAAEPAAAFPVPARLWKTPWIEANPEGHAPFQYATPGRAPGRWRTPVALPRRRRPVPAFVRRQSRSDCSGAAAALSRLPQAAAPPPPPTLEPPTTAADSAA